MNRSTNHSTIVKIYESNRDDYRKKIEERVFCIRCGKKIDLDPNLYYVLCYNCFDRNRDYQGDIWGNYCYICGAYSPYSNINDVSPRCNYCNSKNIL